LMLSPVTYELQKRNIEKQIVAPTVVRKSKIGLKPV